MSQPHPVEAGPSDAESTRVSRQIAADPTSTALLLAAPSAVELWPGVPRVGDVAGPYESGSPPLTAASVTAGPPRRTPTAYESRFAWSGPGLPSTTATLTLSYAPSAAGTPATLALLQLHSTGLAGSRLDGSGLRRLAEGFLGNLGRAAERCATAA